MPFSERGSSGNPLHKFPTGLELERAADKILRRAFTEFPFSDYRDDEQARARGYDYVYKMSGLGVDSKVAIEDKADTKIVKTGNVSLEIFTISRGPRRPGWLFFSEAGLLRYVAFANRECLVLPFTEVRQFMLSRMYDFPPVGAVNYNGHDAFTHISFTLLVPWVKLFAGCPSARIVNMEGLPSLAKDTRHAERVVSAREAIFQATDRMYSKPMRGWPSLEYVQWALDNNLRGKTQQSYISQCRV
jgi:hypothetical protein